MKVLINSQSFGEGIKALSRIDYIMIPQIEFPDMKTFTLAFRGDDRPPEKVFTDGFSYRITEQKKCVSVYDSQDGKIEEKMSDYLANTLMPRAADLKYPWGASATDVVFRPHDFDLVPSSCVSVTLDFKSASQFPYRPATIVYIYVIEREGTSWLPTYEIQKSGPRANVDKCLEITCNQVKGEHILGAIKIKRKVTGPNASCTVDFNIVDLIANPAVGLKTGEELLTVLKNNFPDIFDDIKKDYHYSIKDLNIGGHSHASQNLLLLSALQALQKTLLNGGNLQGMMDCVKKSCAQDKQGSQVKQIKGFRPDEVF